MKDWRIKGGCDVITDTILIEKKLKRALSSRLREHIISMLGKLWK